MLIYFLKTLVVVREYSFTGHSHPECRCMIVVRNARAPWYKDLWFGWDDTPSASKVMITSMFAFGGLSVFVFAISGANAVASLLAMSLESQVMLIESLKSSSSMMNMSSSDRTPRNLALLTSSFFRVSPRPSASPGRLSILEGGAEHGSWTYHY